MRIFHPAEREDRNCNTNGKLKIENGKLDKLYELDKLTTTYCTDDVHIVSTL